MRERRLLEIEEIKQRQSLLICRLIGFFLSEIPISMMELFFIGKTILLILGGLLKMLGRFMVLVLGVVLCLRRATKVLMSTLLVPKAMVVGFLGEYINSASEHKH